MERSAGKKQLQALRNLLNGLRPQGLLDKLTVENSETKSGTFRDISKTTFFRRVLETYEKRYQKS